MLIYNYHPRTKEFIGSSIPRINPLEKNEVLLPANATFKTPLLAGPNQIAVYENDNWVLKPDLRGTKYYKKSSGVEFIITEIDETIPEDSVIIAPNNNLYDPQWDGESWIETALIYKGHPVQTKADVNIVTRNLIMQLDEEKVKTELLKSILSSESVPQTWTDFVTERDQLIVDGNTFVSENNLE